MNSQDQDFLMRMEAFSRLRMLSSTRNYLAPADIGDGFFFKDQRIPFVDQQQGIFKPGLMGCLLSIRTTIPVGKTRAQYDDQNDVHSQIFNKSEYIEYSFMQNDPNSRPNQLLKQAYEQCPPIVYFLGLAPGKYMAVLPVFIIDWNSLKLKVTLVVGCQDGLNLSYPCNCKQRQQTLAALRHRLRNFYLHEAVTRAYGGKCAVTRLALHNLLDVAQICEHSDLLQPPSSPVQPDVTNGLPLSKLHHAMYDQHLIGIDPDYRLHISATVREHCNLPALNGLASIEMQKILLPELRENYPNRDYLAMRFERYRNVAPGG